MNKRSFLAGLVTGIAVGWTTPRMPYGLIAFALLMGMWLGRWL